MTAPAGPGGIGLYGGTFDPPHRGHVGLARAALAELQPACLHVVPCGIPAHRPPSGASGVQRLEMLHLALAGHAGVRVDGRELDRDGPSYTLDTVTELCAEHGVARVWLVLGEDAAQGIPGWHCPEELLAHVHLAVARRPSLREAASTESRWRSLATGAGAEIRELAVRLPDVSATTVRECLRGGLPVDDYLTPPVAAYIRTHGLYANCG